MTFLAEADFTVQHTYCWRTAVIPVRVTDSTPGYIVAVVMGTAYENPASQRTLWHIFLGGSSDFGPFLNICSKLGTVLSV